MSKRCASGTAVAFIPDAIHPHHCHRNLNINYY